MRPEESRRELFAAVARRRQEIGEAVLARVRAIPAPDAPSDAEYLEGVRQAVKSAIDHTIEASSAPDDRRTPIPAPLLDQSRLAARRRTPLETVLRRYLAGHAVLGDFVAEEAERHGVVPAVLQRVLRSQAATTDRVLAAISATYVQELESFRRPSSAQRLSERVNRLLDGELVDASELNYELDRWHVGLVARGPGAADAVEAIVRAFDARRLVIPEPDGSHWGWLGFKEQPDGDRVLRAVPGDLPMGTGVGIGEPAQGTAGWRLTHAQARAAFSVVNRREGVAARYVDVAVLASAMRDEVLMSSLHLLYVDALEKDRDRGALLMQTLRAYLDGDRNLTSTAAALGVSRNTVANRLRTVEKRVGILSPTKAANLALALELCDLM